MIIMHALQSAARRLRPNTLTLVLTAGFACGLGLAACSRGGPIKPALVPVTPFDVNRYMGTWYEVAAMPNPFQKNCTRTQATYRLKPDGEVEVRNSCHKGGLDGPLSEVVGKAWLPAGNAASALKVQIMWPFKGDYWVLALDPNYQWAVVGQPKRKYLWILSRTPAIEPSLLKDLEARLPGWGYDPQRLLHTVQAPEAS